MQSDLKVGDLFSRTFKFGLTKTMITGSTYLYPARNRSDIYVFTSLETDHILADYVRYINLGARRVRRRGGRRP